MSSFGAFKREAIRLPNTLGSSSTIVRLTPQVKETLHAYAAREDLTLGRAACQLIGLGLETLYCAVYGCRASAGLVRVGLAVTGIQDPVVLQICSEHFPHLAAWLSVIRDPRTDR